MSSPPDASPANPIVKKSVLLPAVGMAATSAMLLWGTGLHPLWWLTWLAPFPVLMISPRLPRGRAFWTAALAWFLGSLNMWPYFLKAIALPIPIVLLFSAGPSWLFGSAVLLFRAFIRRGKPGKAALSFPAFWVTFEYVLNVTSRNGTFPNLGYTQMDFLPVLQVASLVGIWGITFSLLLFPAGAAAALSRPGTPQRKVRLAAAAGAFLALVLGFGAWRLMSTPQCAPSVKVGLTATGLPSPFPADDSATMQLLQIYADKAAGLAAQGAELIILPEKIGLISDQGSAQVDALFAAAATRAKASIVVGLDRGTRAQRVNEARLYSPGGTRAAVYDKHHMVPGFEDVDRPGTTIAVLDQASGVWGMQICKDMDFPSLSRQYGAKGVGLLLVPAWDFTLDGWLHSRMAVLRGVENGFTIVRSAKQGALAVSDDRGRILAEADCETAASAALVAAAPVRHDSTPYTHLGDWFAWLNVAGLAALLFVQRRR